MIWRSNGRQYLCVEFCGLMTHCFETRGIYGCIKNGHSIYIWPCTEIWGIIDCKNIISQDGQKVVLPSQELSSPCVYEITVLPVSQWSCLHSFRIYLTSCIFLWKGMLCGGWYAISDLEVKWSFVFFKDNFTAKLGIYFENIWQQGALDNAREINAVWCWNI